VKLPDITSSPGYDDVISMSLAEDLAEVGDVTTEALVREDVEATARIFSRSHCVVAGVDVAASVFRRLAPDMRIEVKIADGATAGPNADIMTIAGRARAILTGERTALNFMQRMCGIATITAEFVEKVKGYGVDILDTRKTTPCLRVFEKYAVLCGGGTNHRMGLHDMVLAKDNHRKLWRETTGCDLATAVQTARDKFPGVPIEVEVETIAEVEDVLAMGPDWILLDNMAPGDIAESVKLIDGRCRVEASGGITIENVEEVARTGVNAISLGCLTHSAPSVDLSLEMCE